MNDDLLERAADAVRERYDGKSEHAARSEDRILSAFDRQTRRRRWVPLVAIPLVAALLTSAAWGTVAARLRALLQSPHSVETARVFIPPKLATTGASGPGPATLAPDSAPSPVQVTPELPVPAAASVHSARRPAAPAITGAPLPAAEPSSPAAGPSESEIAGLYRAAHRAQFSGADPGQALLLWDRYLAAAPNGSLSPEARYNRAIALARLGRKAEAAAALEPFARGDYGGYRRPEAESLLQVLRPARAP